MIFEDIQRNDNLSYVGHNGIGSLFMVLGRPKKTLYNESLVKRYMGHIYKSFIFF